MAGERKKITIQTNGMAPNEIKDIEEAIGGGDSDEIDLSLGVDTEIEMGEESENNPINFNVSMPDEKLSDVDILNMQRISSDVIEDGADELDDILNKKSSDINSEDIMTLRLYVLKNGSSGNKVKLALAKSKIEEREPKLSKKEKILLMIKKDTTKTGAQDIEKRILKRKGMEILRNKRPSFMNSSFSITTTPFLYNNSNHYKLEKSDEEFLLSLLKPKTKRRRKNVSNNYTGRV